MPDPDRAAAQAAVARIQRLSDEHWWTLHQVCLLMRSETWVGPAGRRFGDEVHAAERRLRDLLAEAVTDARQKLSTAPGRP
ncbi:hypothetical protein FH608_046940 [Nonomuraea phyllanthi]|uniref:Uncharacterized protein n=1 Tax=Nonomuraea phyllanthi TaxID=2219224 RepID=A0A5C4V4V9_9ACTN|nr:hypothetical protein [Nonomuraea phyllanthi]KAB8186265.1 hypothetical protein FH608_046940 [Nonomuraea phyllanthi]QFY11596.1 hypothetical protein GBF35_37940 [Nonomuraea phyllanthi]